MITERTIINCLIIGAALIIAPFVVSSTLSTDFVPAAVFGVLALLAIALFYIKDDLCIWPLLGSAVIGSLNFLPLPLGATNIFCILLIIYYLTNYIIVRKKKVKFGKLSLLFPILVVTAILLYHNHSLKLGVLGGNEEGGKAAILIYLGVVAYFCGVNVRSPSLRFLSRFPLYFFLLTVLSSIPYVLTTYFPSLAPVLYLVTSNVDVSAYSAANSGVGGDYEGARESVYGPIGYSLQLYLLCHYPIGTWWRPNRWWIVPVSLFCVFLSVLSGYRNVLFSYVVMVLVATWCFYSWRTLFLPAGALLAAVILIILGNNNMINLHTDRLPIIAQRSLSFLPGDWDQEALQSARSSDDFRKNIRDVYLKEYARNSPLIGNGMTINKSVFDSYDNELKVTGTKDPDYTLSKLFIEGKMFHTGWISVYDIVGIIGFAAFLALGGVEIYMAGKLVCTPVKNQASGLFPIYVWMLADVTTKIISFFVVYGDFRVSFGELCVYGMVLSQLSDIQQTSRKVLSTDHRAVEAKFSGLKNQQPFRTY